MMAGITSQHIVLICLIGTAILPTSNAFILETLGFGASGIVKGSLVAWLQSIGATTGGGYILSSIGFGASGIAKGSIAAALQSLGVTGVMGTLGAGVSTVGAALATGAAGAAYYFNQFNSLHYNGNNQTNGTLIALITEFLLDAYDTYPHDE